MFGETPAVGFIPAPVIDLRAGNLYNVVISLLVFLGMAYSAWMIFNRGKGSWREKLFSFFLLSLGFYWLFESAGNFLSWLNMLPGWLAFPLKLLSIIPPLALFYYYCRESIANRLVVMGLNILYFCVALAYLVFTFKIDGTGSLVTYWGIQWLTGRLPAMIYDYGMLLPLGLIGLLLAMRKNIERADTSLYLGGIIFIMLEYIRTIAEATWYGLLLRLFYILIAFGAYDYFVRGSRKDKFVPRDEPVQPKPGLRISFFAKLLFLFIVLAVIPIIVSSFLMFVSFQEIINIYVQKPLLWNLKTSREAFLLALGNVQLQAVVLMGLTGLLVVLAAILVSRSIAQSLRRVSTGMERVSKGDFSFKLLPDGNDEIGDVVNYFNTMSGEIMRAREVMEKFNHWLEIKVKERTEELRILFDVSKAIGSTLDLDLLIGRSIELLLPILKADLYLVLLPEEDGTFSSRICHGCDKEKLQKIKIAEGEGLLGEALKENKIISSEDIQADPRIQEDYLKGIGARTMIVTPLRAKGKVMGLLIIGTLGEHKYSEEREGNLMAAIADQLAIAIENIGIYEKEKEAVARLTELDRLKNEFISMVSHELRTPVTSADGYVSLFLAGVTGAITEDQKKYLTIIKENNQRLLTLINRLLDFSKIETGRFSIKRELISMNEIIQAVADQMGPQLEKKKALLALKLEAEQANFMGDREKMQEALVNLVENALKFSQDDIPLNLVITTRNEENTIEVSITDNGVGIEKEYLEKIFNKFYQIEDAMTRKVGGVGLGLALVKEIVGNHHGKIWAESEGKGKGSRFIFQLPLAERA